MLNCLESAEGMSDGFWLSLLCPALSFSKCSISRGDRCSEKQG